MTNLDVLKNNVVTSMFVDAADHDYVVSRWCYQSQLYGPFFWNATQAIEKYLKASLLLNARSSKGFSHDIVRLYDAVDEFAGDLLPDSLIQPPEFSGLHWYSEAPKDFIERFNALGDPNNRYNMFGFTQRWSDLSHLDQMIWAIRRVTFGLELSPFVGRPDSGTGVPSTARDLLSNNPNFELRGSSSVLRKLASGAKGEALAASALNLNFPFAPDDYPHDFSTVRIGYSSSESVLFRRVLDRVPHAPDLEAANLADWILENIHLPGGARASNGTATTAKHQLQDAAKALRLTGS